LVTSTLFITVLIVGIFAVELVKRWWRQNEWKRHWREKDKDKED
jgi:hypothetical protein